LKRAPEVLVSQLHDTSHKSVHRGHSFVTSSKSVPACVVDDVKYVVKENVKQNDNHGEVNRFNSTDQYSGTPIIMQTLPFSHDESPLITPILSKKLSSASKMHSSFKAGCSVATPLNISSPEVTIVGSRSLSQKLRLLRNKSEEVYNSKVQKSIVHLDSSRKSELNISSYPSLKRNKFADSSSKYSLNLTQSSTGGKLPLHGPRRTVFPSRAMGDEFEIERAKFRVNKSQILNYKAICNLAMSRQSGEDAILFGAVRCTFWSPSLVVL